MTRITTITRKAVHPTIPGPTPSKFSAEPPSLSQRNRAKACTITEQRSEKYR
jgi:hypothetical protein